MIAAVAIFGMLLCGIGIARMSNGDGARGVAFLTFGAIVLGLLAAQL